MVEGDKLPSQINLLKDTLYHILLIEISGSIDQPSHEAPNARRIPLNPPPEALTFSVKRERALLF